MTTAWTADHIGSLAPDAASLTAARKLRGKWSGTGIHDTALWGLCQGSGNAAVSDHRGSVGARV